MRVAVLISGMMRMFWHNYYNVLKTIIEPNDADVFIFSGGGGRFINTKHFCPINPESSSLNTRGDEAFALDINEREYFTQKLGKYLKKIKFVDDDKDTFYEEYNNLKIDPSMLAPCGAPQQWFVLDAYLRQKKCFELIENYEKKENFKYDAIIRLRSDIIFEKPIILSEYNFNNNEFYGESIKSHLIRDVFYFCSRNLMEIISKKFVQELGRINPSMLHPQRGHVALPNSIRWKKKDGEVYTDLEQFCMFLIKYKANLYSFDSYVYKFNRKIYINEEWLNQKDIYALKTNNCPRTSNKEIIAFGNRWKMNGYRHRFSLALSYGGNKTVADGGYLQEQIKIDYNNEIAKKYHITTIKTLVL